jgi:hypothetical protein
VANAVFPSGKWVLPNGRDGRKAAETASNQAGKRREKNPEKAHFFPRWMIFGRIGVPCALVEALRASKIEAFQPVRCEQLLTKRHRARQSASVSTDHRSGARRRRSAQGWLKRYSGLSRIGT